MPSTNDSQTPRQLHQQILRHFAATGRAPAMTEMQAMLGGASRQSVEECLKLLDQEGAIYRDPQSKELRAAYPFSPLPTQHRVKFANGVEVYAMCAIDALGTPFMLETDATISSECHHCHAPIEVEVQKGKVSQAHSQHLVVWYSTNDTCCASAVDQCPHINFFCSQNYLEQWRQQHPEQKGHLLTLAEALDRSQQIFGSLLKQGR